MSRAYNLGTVIRFEVKRTLKKPSFWLMALGFPVLIAGVFAIAFWSNEATIEAADKLKNQKITLAVTDQSGLVKEESLQAIGATRLESRQEGIDRVKAKTIDAYIYFPSDLATQRVEIFGQDAGMFENSKYTAIATALLDQSVSAQVSQQQQAVLRGQVSMTETMFRNGEKYDSLREMIAPGLFLILFYLLIGMFGNQMLSSTIEEKENRTIEMLLTTVRPQVLISGKILSLVLLAIILALTAMLPVIILYLIAGSQLHLPNFELSNIPLDPLKIGMGALIFGLSFLLFTGLLVAVGAIMPTAKEASQWFGLVVLFIFGPLYGVTAFISHPDAPFVKFLTLFPLTSPVPLMLRNAYGNLPIGEALMGVAILAISAAAILLLSVKIFRYGAMQYDSKLSFKALRARRSSDTVKP